MKVSVEVTTPIIRSVRVAQLEGMFDVPQAARASQSWQVELPIEDKPWHVGLIVGPSGCGKSTVARKLFPEQLARTFNWPPAASLLDAFPAKMGVQEIVELLSSVGFSSPPSWTRPFQTLSNGEQFRTTMARVLAESGELAVVDEFTSVVDRTVARIGSCAIAKTVRKRSQKFVAVSCHEDVEEWLQPDWIYRPAEQRFMWRSLQRRPAIELQIRRVHHSAWRLFKHHHYLTAELSKAAVCFVAFWNGTPVAFDAWLPFFGKLKDQRQGRRGHRTVCLPDYQGVGIGNALFDFGAALWAGQGYRAFSTTGHPAELRRRMRNPKWVMTRSQGMTAKESGKQARPGRAPKHACTRLTASFEYVGPALSRAEGAAVLGARV